VGSPLSLYLSAHPHPRKRPGSASANAAALQSRTQRRLAAPDGRSNSLRTSRRRACTPRMVPYRRTSSTLKTPP